MATVTEKSLHMLQSLNENKTFEKDQIQLCLVCCSNIETSMENCTELISKNVEIFFLLKNLLQVPSVHFERNLKEYGNPGSWICLCEQCTELVAQAKYLHFQIIEMTKKLKSMKKLIVNKTRSSSVKHNSSRNCKRKDIWKGIRNFVSNYGYIGSTSADLINPFIEGDKLAKYLLAEQNAPDSFEDDETPYPSPNIKVEVEPDIDNDTDTGSFYDNSNYHDDDDGEDAEVDTDKEICTTLRQQKKERPPPHLQLPWSSMDRKNKKMLRINGRWKCRYCDKLFGSTRSVYAHEHTKHVSSIPKAQHICETCGKSCFTLANLNMHRRSVHKIKLDGNASSKVRELPCSLCEKVFKCKLNLERHVKHVHEKVLEHRCHLCGMQCGLSSCLKRHQLSVHKDDPDIKNLIAEGIRIWRCKVKGCRAQFMKKSNFDKHSTRYHKNSISRNGNKEDKKRFTCGYCGKGFWSKDYHRTHELLHKNKGSKPYSCDLCGESFATPLYLRQHKYRSHKKEAEKSDTNGI